MATQPRSLHPPEIDYPTRDGKPEGETPGHRDILFDLVYLLRRRFNRGPTKNVG